MPKNKPIAIANPSARNTEYGSTTGVTFSIVTKPLSAIADDRADDAADAGEQHGLDEELREDVAVAGADRLADADLTGALGDGHEHDVHDADAADEQRDRGDRGEQHRERPVVARDRRAAATAGSAR